MARGSASWAMVAVAVAVASAGILLTAALWFWHLLATRVVKAAHRRSRRFVPHHPHDDDDDDDGGDGGPRRPRNYRVAEPVDIRFNSLFSWKTQLLRDYSHLPFCYAPYQEADEDASTDLEQPSRRRDRRTYGGDYTVVVPEEYVMRVEENRTTTPASSSSPYAVYLRGRYFCETACVVRYDDPDHVNNLRSLIENEYRHHWRVDDLPSAAMSTAGRGRRSSSSASSSAEEHARYVYGRGFPVGFVDPRDKMPYVFNHVKIRLFYHQSEESESDSDSAVHHHIVRFAVEPVSVRHAVQVIVTTDHNNYDGNGNTLSTSSSTTKWPRRPYTCPASRTLRREDVARAQVVQVGETVLYTYEVAWERTDVPWSDRWDAYLSEGHRIPADVHIIPLSNATTFMLVCSFFLGMAARRHRRQNEALLLALGNQGGPVTMAHEGKDSIEAAQEPTPTPTPTRGADPRLGQLPMPFPLLYCCLVGSGIQLFVVTMAFLLLGVAGVISQTHPGSLVSSALLLHAFTGTVSGFVSARLFAALARSKPLQPTPGPGPGPGPWPWQRCAALTGVLVPGVSILLWVVFELALEANRSVTAGPRHNFVLLVAALWLGVHVPLVCLGSWFGSSVTTRPSLKLRSLRDCKLAVSLYLPLRESNHQSRPARFPSAGAIALLAVLVPFLAIYVELLWQNDKHQALALAIILAGFSVQRFLRRRRGNKINENRAEKNPCTGDDLLYGLLAGLPAYLCLYVEVFFLWPALWMEMYFDSFLFVLCACVLAAVLCAASATLLAARQVLRETWWWPWTALLGPGGGVAVLLFWRSAFWFHTVLVPSPRFVTYLIYYGSVLWMCAAVILMFGSVGATVCLWLFSEPNPKKKLHG